MLNSFVGDYADLISSAPVSMCRQNVWQARTPTPILEPKNVKPKRCHDQKRRTCVGPKKTERVIDLVADEENRIFEANGSWILFFLRRLD